MEGVLSKGLSSCVNSACERLRMSGAETPCNVKHLLNITDPWISVGGRAPRPTVAASTGGHLAFGWGVKFLYVTQCTKYTARSSR